MSASVPTANTITSAFSSLTNSRTWSTYWFPVAAAPSSTLQTYKTGLVVMSWKSSISSSSSWFCGITVRADLACNRASRIRLRKACSTCASLLPVLAARLTFSRRFSTVSKSFNCNSISIVSLSRIGLTLPSTWTILSLSKQRNTWMIALHSLIFAKNWLPKPSPLLAPFTKPAISTISTVAICTRSGFTNSSNLAIRGSGTLTTPMLGSMVQNGKLALCALALDKQLNKVDFPTLGKPTIPAFICLCYFKKVCKYNAIKTSIKGIVKQFRICYSPWSSSSIASMIFFSSSVVDKPEVFQ